MALKKQLDQLYGSRPEYNISSQYYDNQALAKTAAFGRDRAIQRQESNLEQESADAIGMAGQYSNSASGILSTLSSISGSKNQALRNLAVDEAAIGRQKMQDLYGANIGLAEEEDKAFEYNVNMPYQKKIERMQEKLRRRQMITDSLTGAAIAVGGSAATSGTTQNGGSGNGQGAGQGPLFGMLGSIFSDERLKKNIKGTDYGLNEILDLKVVEYQYTESDPTKNHVGLLAQNVLEQIPEAVDLSGKHLKVDYNEIVPVLIKAIQEQQKIIDLLRTKVAA